MADHHPISSIPDQFLFLDPQDLKPDTLINLAREFILRDSPEDFSVESSVEDKIPSVVTKIRSGELKITFDTVSESVGLMGR